MNQVYILRVIHHKEAEGEEKEVVNLSLNPLKQDITLIMSETSSKGAIYHLERTSKEYMETKFP